MGLGRWNTVAPGVKRAPGPSRVSRVRNMETPSWSGVVCAGKPIVRRAEFLGGTGCPRSGCLAAERQRDPLPTPPLLQAVAAGNRPDAGLSTGPKGC